MTFEETQQIATTILQQLGGKQFTAMTRSKNYIPTNVSKSFFDLFALGPNQTHVDVVDGSPALTMALSRLATTSSKCKATHLYVVYNYGPDDYTMVFVKIHGATITVVETYENVQGEDLQRLFTETTGLHTTMGTNKKRSRDE